MRIFLITIGVLLSNNVLADANWDRFNETVEYIKNYYVHEKQDPELLELALEGMLVGLDPHSSYLDADEFKQLKISTSGKFGGLGVHIVPEDGLVRVVSPIDDTPAFRSGIKSGDLIIKLDGVAVQSMSLKDAVKKMHGRKGTTITLTILRKGESNPLNIKVVRDIISVRSSRELMLHPGFGYIRIANFQEDTQDEVIKGLRKLTQSNNGNLNGLILDLRNNPGGLVDSCVAVADLFLDRNKLINNKLIVYTNSRVPGAQMKETAHSGDLLNNAPIIVLVNGGSASASEIVAGALQDHKRAIILGSKTFGKGSMQTILPLKDQHGIKLTTALYFTPNGRSIQASGIVPDILVPQIAVPKEHSSELLAAFNISEATLSGHIKQPENSTNSSNKSKTKEKEQKNNVKAHEILTSDYQVYQALLMLKALSYGNS